MTKFIGSCRQPRKLRSLSTFCALMKSIVGAVFPVMDGTPLSGRAAAELGNRRSRERHASCGEYEFDQDFHLAADISVKCVAV